MIGGGPGDPGLLTLRGKALLERAEVVLFDRLVGEDILALIPARAETVDVGKSAGRHLLPQEEINALILRHAARGKRVVRLKGGDPYLFGRGAEELEAVEEAGIPFEVVPGVTSAIAVPAFGGIPITHRDMASSVHIITGHPRHGGELSIAFDSLAALDGTLVFLMGVGAIRRLAEGLLAAGMPGETPAALVENGTRYNQRKLVSTLAGIAAKAKEEGFKPPSVLVVGEVCSLADRLDWRSRLPLWGRKILVTREAKAAGDLTQLLREQGADVVGYPCIRTEPLSLREDFFERLSAYRWLVFTSPVGVECFFAELARREKDVRVLTGIRLAAVGPKTAAGLRSRGLLPDYVPEKHNASSLAEGLLARLRAGEKLLLCRAERAAPVLPERLREAGYTVEDAALYETLYENPAPGKTEALLESGEIDLLTFTSASTVRGFAASLPGMDHKGRRCVCIGEETASAAREYGFDARVSEEASMESLVDCIIFNLP